MNKEKLIRRRMQDAEKHHRLGHLERASELYESVLKIEPGHEGANIGNYKASSNRWPSDKAISESDRLVELFPENPETWMLRGLSYSKVQKTDTAEASYRRCIALDPENHRAVHNLGSLLFAFGDKDEGLSLLERAVELSPDYEIGYSTLALSYYRSGRYSDSIRAVERVLDMMDDAPDLQIAYGDSLYQSGDYPHARKIFSHIVEQTLLSSQMYAMLCPLLKESEGYHHQGSVPDADVDFLAATYYRAFLSLDTTGEKTPISATDLEKVIAVNPAHSYALSGLASLHKLNKQVPDAIIRVDQAIEHDPHNLVFIRQKAFIIIDDDPAGSLDMFESLLARDPADIRSALGKSWALKSVGRDEESKALLKKLSEQDPAFIFSLMRSPLGGGDTHRSGGNRVRAMSEQVGPDGVRRVLID
ncbi:MAG: tetratricopeptide repeat protein [Methanospirillum sp.]|uniref:tetratricopeptide repeat protein n=1 Tax=Methanospirillum sp. TaxID=45200 RepID=UPI00236EF6CF|nr:tetratricopeptide repeat protein [Methanospirillum sp.]MDD1728451.1 tetratricopeptide repeat protein [Methanospirillum sp.]